MRRDFEDFLVFKGINDGRSDRTVAAYRDILTRFEQWLDGRDPWALSTDEVMIFTGPYLFQVLHLEPVSRTPYVACIRGLYKWHSTYRGGRNLAGSVPYPKTGRKLPTAMTLDNAERLMWSPDFSTFEGVRDAAMLGLLMGCGLRVSGLTALNESNIVSQTIEGAPRLAIRPTEKGRKERLIPIPIEADLLLRAYMAHPDLEPINRTLPNGDRVLFITTRNRHCPAHAYHGEARRFSRKGVNVMILRHGKRAQIPRNELHPHALRHLYGAEMAESDVDINTRQQLLGHADPKTTQIYDQIAQRKLTRTTDKANPLGKTNNPASQLLANLARKPKPSSRST